MQEIVYHAPRSITEVRQILAQYADAKVLAGGTDLVPQLREMRVAARHVIDIKHVPELTEITLLPGGAWRIGAAVNIGALGRHATFRAAHPDLLAAAQLIGSLQIQNRASLGGNLCNAAPSADAVPILICMGAIAEIAGSTQRRRVPVEGIGTGPGRTSLGSGEVLVAIEVPPPQLRTARTYLRFTPRREMDIAIAGVAAELRLDANGHIADARIALASVAPTVLVASTASRLLIGAEATKDGTEAAAAAAAHEARPISDARASADYRRGLIRTLTARVLSTALSRLGAKI